MESSVWKNPNTVAVWLWCLLRANHKPTKIAFNGVDIELKAGEFITGREIACKEIKISPQIYRTAITYLKSTNRITTKSTNRFTIICIDKWKEYQSKLTNEITKEVTNQQPTTNQPLTTDKKYKNIKNDKEVLATGVADNLNPLIELFKPINPSYERLYANKTQRGALQRLVDKHGEEKIVKILETIQKTNQVKYAPTITTPLELENKLATLLLFLKREQGVSQSVKL